MRLGKVLIVEDDDFNRNVFASFLRRDCFEVAEAANGAEGFERALTWRPDLIITDLVMPKVDGWGLIAQLRRDETTAWIPVVVLTADALATTRERALALGVKEYLVKPVSHNRLRRMIAAVLKVDVAEATRLRA